MDELFHETKAQTGMREKIHAAANGDTAAEKFLRDLMAGTMQSAPRHQLIRICQFFMAEIYPEAQQDAARVN